jgi:hypothetical protein
MARRSFQQGSLFQRGTRRKLWVARWWEDVMQIDGTLSRLRRSEVVGTVADLADAPESDAGSVSEVKGNQQWGGSTAFHPNIRGFREE